VVAPPDVPGQPRAPDHGERGDQPASPGVARAGGEDQRGDRDDREPAAPHGVDAVVALAQDRDAERTEHHDQDDDGADPEVGQERPPGVGHARHRVGAAVDARCPVHLVLGDVRGDPVQRGVRPEGDRAAAREPRAAVGVRAHHQDLVHAHPVLLERQRRAGEMEQPDAVLLLADQPDRLGPAVLQRVSHGRTVAT
jgi:hypothetical protein